MTQDSVGWLEGTPPPEVSRLLRAAQRNLPHRDVVERIAHQASECAARVSMHPVPHEAWARCGAKSSLIGVGASIVVAGALGDAPASTVVEAPALSMMASGQAPPQRNDIRMAQLHGGMVAAATRIAAIAQRLDVHSPNEEAETASDSGVIPAESGDSDSIGQALRPLSALSQNHPRSTVQRVVATRRRAGKGEVGTHGSELDRQIAMVTSARGALSGGKPAVALEWLARYRRGFKKRDFSPEALYLEYRSHRALGHRAAAARSKRALVKKFPRSLQAQQLASLQGSEP